MRWHPSTKLGWVALFAVSPPLAVGLYATSTWGPLVIAWLILRDIFDGDGGF